MGWPPLSLSAGVQTAAVQHMPERPIIPRPAKTGPRSRLARRFRQASITTAAAPPGGLRARSIELGSPAALTHLAGPNANKTAPDHTHPSPAAPSELMPGADQAA